MKILLGYGPFNDPTSPYHSLAYLASFIRSKGFSDVIVRDFNVEWFDHEIKSSNIKKLFQKAQVKYSDLKCKSKLSITEAENYKNLHILLSKTIIPIEIEDALRALKDSEKFYNFEIYDKAMSAYKLWTQLYSAVYFPLNLGVNLENRRDDFFNMYFAEDLAQVDTLSEPASSYLEWAKENIISQIKEESVAVLGLSAAFDTQLLYTLALAQLVKKECPNVKIILGGTAFSDWWKKLEDKSKMEVFFEHYCHYMCLGEGETAFWRFLEKIKAKEEPRNIKGILCYDEDKKTLLPFPGVFYEDINKLPTPDYSDVVWEQYFSPDRMVLYSPTRGCYWNKCTFCDYGLNTDGPTSPWRHRDIGLITKDLKEISKDQRFIYFAVDVLSPKGIREMAEAIISENIEIRWGAELRLEKTYKADLARLLKKSGCVALSVGYESGNQRILNLMDKGTKVKGMPKILEDVSNNGIALEMMSFVNFPTETYAEACETIDFLAEHQDYWSLFGVGNFTLTPGSYVAKRPDDFGITLLNKPSLTDSEIAMLYEEKNPAKSEEEKIEISEYADSLLWHRNVFIYDRPWLGGTDTPHTYFYLDKFGSRFFHEHTEKKNGTLKRGEE
jgi:hypothetical protein